jgi:hypothetical protein
MFFIFFIGRAAASRRRAMPFGAASRSLHHPRRAFGTLRVVPLLSLSLRGAKLRFYFSTANKLKQVRFKILLFYLAAQLLHKGRFCERDRSGTTEGHE